MKKIFIKALTFVMICSLTVIPPVWAEEYSFDISDISQWQTAENSKSEDDAVSMENGVIHYYDKGGAVTDTNSQQSGFTLYHDFDLPLTGDVSVSFKMKADKTSDFSGIKFLSNMIKGVHANAYASLGTNQIMNLGFSGKIWATTNNSQSLIDGYNWSGDYWYSFDIVFHLTGNTDGNTVDLKITNDAENYFKIDDEFTGIPISGGGALSSIVIGTNKNRTNTLENNMYIKDFSVLANDIAENDIVIKVGTDTRQTFSGFGINAPGGMTPGKLHSDSKVEGEMYEKVFRDLNVTGIRIWTNMGLYLQKDENGSIVYDLNAANPYVDNEYKYSETFESNYIKENGKTIFDIAKRYGVEDIILAPSGLYQDGYKIPEWMKGTVTDPYTGANQTGFLLPEYAVTYGEGLARAIYDIKDKYNVRVTATSIFNELGGCIADREIVTIIRALRNKLDELGLDYVKILAPEYSTNSVSKLSRFLNYIKENDIEAWNILDGIANHSYSCAIGKSESDFLLQNPKPLWMTELCEEGEITATGYPECAHSAGIFLNDINHMTTNWYYFVGANAVNSDILNTRGAGADLMYTEYTGASNVGNISERVYNGTYTLRPSYYYMKQISDAFKPGTKMKLCTSSREGEMELNDSNDNKIYASAGITADGGLSIAVLNNTSTEVQQKDFENGSRVRRLSDENITVKIDLSDYNLSDIDGFDVVSTSPDGALTGMGRITDDSSVITITTKPSELITLSSIGRVSTLFDAGIHSKEKNVVIEGQLKTDYTEGDEINVMLARKDTEGNVTDIAYFDRALVDANGNYGIKFRLPQAELENGILKDYKIYVYHKSFYNLKDSIIEEKTGSVMDWSFNKLNFDSAEASIGNIYGDDEAYKVIISYYDENDKLIGCTTSEEKQIQYEDFTENSRQYISLDYELPDSAVRIKAFAWNSKLVPLTETRVIKR